MSLRAHGRRVLREVFTLGQRVGVDVLPRHFYSSIPDVTALDRSAAWRQPRSMTGILGVDLAEQHQFLHDCLTDPVRQQLDTRSVYAEAATRNGAVGYGPMEAQILYAFAAHHRPEKVVQVGAGLSTALLLAAAADFGFPMEILCVDPYPTAFLVEAARKGEIELLQQPAQDVDRDRLTDVGAGGLLFVDSTHTVKPGSEVNRLILEVLPRLPTGSFAHFHDITFPYDYPPDLLEGRLFFWQETTLLLAFLTGNPSVRIVLSTSMLHHGLPDALTAELPGFELMPVQKGISTGEGCWPSATYLLIG